MNLIEVLEKNRENDIFFFGAGGVFRTAIERHKDVLSGLHVRGVFDNDERKWGSEICGFRVLSLDVLADCKKDALFIITSSYALEIKNQLSPYQLNQVYSYHDLVHIGRVYSEAEKAQLENVKRYLADEKSREIIDFIIRKRDCGDCRFEEICEDDQYFVEGIIHLGPNEVFVDGGAFVGDTVERIIAETGNHFAKMYALEPDKDNHRTLQEKFGEDDLIVPIKAGLGRMHQELFFISNEDNCEAGRIAEDGNEVVMIESIDESISGPVTFIKLDVEGYEMDTLRGARKTIQKNKPTLAICLYHKAEDLYEIPQYIHALVPEYRLFVRHHTGGVAETVLYAVLD